MGTRKSPENPRFFANPSGDGRGNAQLLTLTRVAVSRPFQWQIICFDQSEAVAEKEPWSRIQPKQTLQADAHKLTEGEMLADWRERDATMASNLLRESQSIKATKKVLAICGNLHARTRNDMHEPMLSELWPSFAAVLKQRQPALRVSSVNIEFHSGAFFNNGKVNAIRQRPLEHAVVQSAGQSGCNLVLRLPMASPATLLSPKHGSRDDRASKSQTDARR